jgi:hypothetical protein
MPHQKIRKKTLVGFELHPSFDVSSPPGCCPQSHEILLYKGGYEILKFMIKCTKVENIYSYNTHNNNNDWLKAFKKRKYKANLI